MNVACGNFLWLLSDTARYMMKAAQTLRVMYPSSLHVTCTAHFLHNCAVYLRSHYEASDNSIASIKAAMVNNKDRRAVIVCRPLHNQLLHVGQHVWRHHSIMRMTLTSSK